MDKKIKKIEKYQMKLFALKNIVCYNKNVINIFGEASTYFNMGSLCVFGGK
ncbi:MAG: hypothetical protein E6Z21_02740 [Anaerococcus vaginalis]|nr:hypothetical protein [Anaerococcus vaginalis]MDU6063618.1 hypothetical protein [Anaerococcus sp.]